MKARVSIFFVILASISILVHAATPHHHRNRAFVSVVNLLHNASADRPQHVHTYVVLRCHCCNPEAGHQPYSHAPVSEDSGDCQLIESLGGGYRIAKDVNATIVPSVAGTMLHIDFCSLPPAYRETQVTVTADNEFPPYTTDIHLRHTPTCDALRAPPAC